MNPGALRKALRSPRARKTALLGVTLGPLCVLVLLRLGIRHDALASDYPGPAPLSSEVLARFAYPEQGAPARELSSFAPRSGWGWSSRWVHLQVTTPGEDTPHRVQVIHVQPDPAPTRPMPAVVVTPILGGRRELALLIAHGLARRGLQAAVVLKAESYFDAHWPLQRLERVLRTAIVDRRRTIDWLERQPQVDADRIGAIGVSLGGLATVLLTAVEPRVKAAVVMMAGGDLGDVVSRTDEPRILRFVEQLGRPPAALRAEISRAVPSDPLALAPAIDARQVFLIQTRYDRTVPADCQDRLWEALGRPQRCVLPTGHYTAAVYLPYALPLALDQLEARLR